MSRERLARLADTSTSTITRIEREGHVPNAAVMVRIARALDTSVEALVESEVSA